MSVFTRIRWDIRGSTIVEFTLVFPVFALVAFGTVDAGYAIFDFARASHAAYVGAHRAVVSDPVAKEIATLTWPPASLGNQCADPTTGANSACPSQTVTCAYTNNAWSCSQGFTFQQAPLDDIASVMQTVFRCTSDASCPLKKTNIQVTYQTNGLGFVGQPSGSSVDVTVSVRCMVHTLYFLGALMNWTFSPAAGCAGPVNGWPVPTYATTLTSEDMVTN